MPLARRLPKRGFKNIFRVEYQVVNVSRLDVFESGTEVDPAGLLARRMIRKKEKPVKILGKGEISLPLTVKVHAVSETARNKIEAAGGRIELIESGR
jgi:large subunit ribosomal protein L15